MRVRGGHVSDRLHLKVISLYTGVGGLDLGFEAAGYRTVAAVEIDPVACKVLARNRPHWNIIQEDISAVGSSQLLDAARLRPKEADVLIGGPPCQPFSKSGYWATGDTRRLDDPRATTLHHYFRIMRATLPRAFLIENVLGLSYSGKSEGLEFIKREIALINRRTGIRYSVGVQSLNASDFGVPQLRERVFVVGARNGTPFQFPRPTHGTPERVTENENLAPYTTAWDAIGDLPQDSNDPELVVSGKWADLLPTIPEGKNYLWHTPRGGGEPLFGWRTRYWNFLLKLSKSQPSWTIQAQPGPATGPFHWRNRKLSAEELSRLQTFPKTLYFDICKRSDIQRLIGNAVPSALAEVLAREIRVQLLGASPWRKTPSLIPKKRAIVPAPERPLPVPKKYRDLAGPHAEHPGTGRGAGALRRLSSVA
jgi:DNA (cytosine-5)-methyltransferase 1